MTIRTVLFGRQRNGFTLIELMVVVGIIGVLLSLLFPAINAARESTRRKQCGNNLKQLGLAILSFHNAKQQFPSTRTSTALGSPVPQSWIICVLPYLEQPYIFEHYDKTKTWDELANREAVDSRIPVVECPSTDHNRQDYGTPMSTQLLARTSDYGVVNKVDDRLKTQGLVDVAGLGAMPKNSQSTLTHMADGVSNTIMAIESAGRPQVYRKGAKFGSLPNDRINGGAWASPATDLALIGSSTDGTTAPGPCALNCTNGEPFGYTYPHPIYDIDGTGQFYSFHAAGVNSVFADGSVHMLNPLIDIRVMAHFITRAGKDKIDVLTE